MKTSTFLKSKLKSNILICLAVILGCGLSAYANYLLTPMGNALKNGSSKTFFICLSLMLIFILMSYALRYWSQYLFVKNSQNYIHNIRKRITENNYNTPYNSKSVANIQNDLTNDLNILEETFLIPQYKILNFALDIIFSAAVVLTFNIYLLVLIFVLAFALLLLPKYISGPLQKLTNKVSEKNQVYLDLIEKWMSGLAVLQRYHSKFKLLDILSEGAHGLEKAKVNKEKTSDSINMLSTGLNMLAQVLINGLTGYLILTGNLAIGVFFSIGNFASLIFSELVVLNQNTTMIQSAKDLNNKLSVELKPVKNKENSQNNIVSFAELSIDKLQEHFNNGEVISYPDITIKSGEKILLSGDSGTGKSTLFKLILGELKPTKGKIIFKDKNGQEIHPNLAQIGYIPQDPTLFPGTIKENITMFNNELDSEAEEVAKKMQLGTDLQKLPNGINTYINLDQLNLSGGQRQKIVLARTKVYRSKLLLIDEGTSAIDEKATLKILKNILQGPETVVFIAHNWSKELHDMFDREIYLQSNK